MGRIRHTQKKRFTAAADLPQPNVSLHIDKTTNFFFKKLIRFVKFEIIEIFIIYYDIVT
jgi:hypothetical protein